MSSGLSDRSSHGSAAICSHPNLDSLEKGASIGRSPRMRPKSGVRPFVSQLNSFIWRRTRKWRYHHD